MPALPVIADVYRLAWLWRHVNSGATAVNVMHWKKAGSTPALLYASMNAHMASQMNATTTANAEIYQVDITPLDGTSSTSSFLTGGTERWHGQGVTADMIPQGAAIVKLQTGLRGRSNRGRLFLPFVAESEQVSGTLDPAHPPVMATEWARFLTDMAADGFELGVASYKLATWHVVTQLTIETKMATQRRRMDRLR
jgi:hypothetical protein